MEQMRVVFLTETQYKQCIAYLTDHRDQLLEDAENPLPSEDAEVTAGNLLVCDRIASLLSTLSCAVSFVPVKCDIPGCTKVAEYDAKTRQGPWANLCQEHFTEHGMGLGIGRGQRLTNVYTK